VTLILIGQGILSYVGRQYQYYKCDSSVSGVHEQGSISGTETPRPNQHGELTQIIMEEVSGPASPRLISRDRAAGG
jgi:hypothetical protein